MPRKKRVDDPDAQSRRFVETAKKLGATKSTAKFERVFRKVVPTSKAQKKR
jgi:hypothetical protein